jgi:uncharacterized protein YyaL (SSP411 family)
MTDPEGGFHSSEDADSEGVEGKFYVWTPAQIEEILGAETAERFCDVYDVTPSGNFEHGTSILHRPKTLAQVAQLKGWDLASLEQEMATARRQLFEAREERVRPGKDDKVLTSWNGLAIDALARAAAPLGEPRFLAAAIRAGRFILQEMRDEQGRLLHSWRRGRARFLAYLDDYACLINALVSLFEATADESWVKHAADLADAMTERFMGHESGRLFYTAADHESLITRVSDLYDSATPSGNGMAATALVRLGKLLHREQDLEIARRILDSSRGALESTPLGAGQMLIALDMLLGPFSELVVVSGEDQPARDEALDCLRTRYLPRAILASRCRASDPQLPELDHLYVGRPLTDPPTLYVCEGPQCQAPIRGVKAICQVIRHDTA